MILGRVIGIGAVVLTLGLMVTPAARADAGTATLSVPASAAAGVSALPVSAADRITISASGSAGYGFEGAAPCVGAPTTHPDGSRFLGSTNCGPKDDPNATLSGQAIGLLIARIGTGAWFAVGTFRNIKATVDGTLTLAYNDSSYSDNSGSYSVTVTDNGPPCVAPTAAVSSTASARVLLPAASIAMCSAGRPTSRHARRRRSPASSTMASLRHKSSKLLRTLTLPNRGGKCPQ